jgi:hypothetical protein
MSFRIPLPRSKSPSKNRSISKTGFGGWYTPYAPYDRIVAHDTESIHPSLSHRLDLGRSNIIYQRMLSAISYLNHDPAIQERHVSVTDHQPILQGTRLRDILLRSFTPALEHTHSEPLQPPDEKNYVAHETLEHGVRLSGNFEGAFKEDMRIQSWARRYMRPNPVIVEGDPVLEGLNATQIRAVATMIGERLSLIQGVGGLY